MNLYGAADRIAPIQTRDYPALGFDPAPGGVPRVVEVATNLDNVARELGEAYTDLTQIGQSGGIWQGEAAEAFQGKVGELPDYLDKAHRSLSGAAATLKSWGEDLGTMQQTAADYERQATEALHRVQQAEANPNLGLAGQFFTDAAELQRAEAALAEAQQQLSSANASLDQIRENAQRLLDQHHDLAGQVAEALRRAKDEAPEEPGFLDKLGDALGDMVDGIKDLASEAWKWVQEHADVIAKIGDVLSTIGTVLSVVAVATSWIPGVNAVTAAAAVGVSAAALGAHALAKAAGANVSWSTMAFDAIGMIPGGGAAKGALGAAKVLPKAVKAGRTAAKFADEGAKIATGAQAAAKTISRAGAQAVGSRANLVNKGIELGAKLVGKNPDDVAKLALNSWETGAKTVFRTTEMAHTAQSGAAVAAGAGVLAVEKGTIQAGKWEAQPYIEQGENAVKEFAGNAAQGFQQALAGRAS